MAIFASLSRNQKESVGLLQIGTFLEYFDLMLYVHMAVLLNELFFPKTDPHTAALLTAFAFCSTYVLRPLGALLFGYIGDNIGRKSTVIITTMLMAISCLFMANLPTYAEVGIKAAWMVTICRIVQGMSSMGEIIGAQVYVTELIKPPVQYPAVGTIAVASAFGAVVALVVALLVTTIGFNWRIAFWIGACIAVIGSMARIILRETPEFVDAKTRMKKAIEDSSSDGLEKVAGILKSTNVLWKEKVNKKTGMASMLINLVWPFWFFFVYVYCPNIFANKFGYTSAQIIQNNFYVSLFQFLGFFTYMRLSYNIHPLRLLKSKIVFSFVFVLLIPPFLIYNNSIFNLALLQASLIFVAPGSFPAEPIFIKHFPIFRRFTTAAFIYALSRAVMYVITSFSLIYLTDWFGYIGLWAIMLPVSIGFLWGVRHFQKLEKQFA